MKLTSKLSQKNGGLRLSVLGGVSSMALIAFAGAAFAQTAPAAKDTAAKSDDTIVVTGIRGSLQRAMNLKRKADGVVDGIAAEDIGKYPDTNLADSLQRITGVSINRVNGEGEQITVRGFGPGYNSVTVDGRLMPASTIGTIGGGQGADGAQGNSRAFDFSNIASDGVQAVQVYKTGRADVEPGGIGAAVNVVTLQPLSTPGEKGSITLKGLTSDHPGLGTVLKKEAITPEISGAYQWTNSDATFGVAVFGSYQDKTGSTRSDTVNHWTIQKYSDFLANGSYAANGGNPNTVVTNAPSNPNQLVATPSDSRLTYAEDSLVRTNGEVVVQWKPIEHLTITANSFYAESKAKEARSELTNWFSQSPYKALTFDGNTTIDSAVVVTDNVPNGKDQGYENELRAVNTKVQSSGLNFKYEPNDNWTFTFDAAHSTSATTPGNSNGTSSTTVSVGQEYVSSDTTTFGSLAAPVQNVTLDPTKSPTKAQDVASISSGYSFENFSQQSDVIDEYKFDFAYKVDDDSKLTGGFDYHKNINEEQYSQVGARFGDWSGTNPGDLLKYGGTAIDTFCMACQFQSVNLTPGGNPNANTAYRFNAVTAFAGLAAYYSSPSFAPVLATSTGASAKAPYANGFSHNKVQEAVSSAYAQFSMKSNFLSRPVKILAGIRYELTDVSVTAFQNIPTNISWDQKNNFSIVQGSSVQPYTQTASYFNLLPSLDMSMNVTDQITGRMSFSQTMARPQYSSMYGTTSVNAPGNPSYLGYIMTASSGNPSLKPLQSDNFDISAEYYYGKNSYVSLGYYRKAVQNFIGSGVTTTSLFGLTDPASGKAGTRSGAAVTALQALAAAGNPNAAINTNTLFVMTALIDQNKGNVAAAQANFANLTDPNNKLFGAGGAASSFGTFQTAIFGNYPVVSNSTDPIASFQLSQPINNHTANIDGFEFAVQHFFGDTGLGIAASATTVNGDVKLNDAADPNGSSQFALEGLSNTYNVTGIYEKYGYSARIVYNWRDKYLNQANAAQFGGLYTAAYGQWDASVNYNVTPQIILSFEALNLNKGHVVQYIRVPTDVVNYQELDTRYEFGVRYKF